MAKKVKANPEKERRVWLRFFNYGLLFKKENL